MREMFLVLLDFGLSLGILPSTATEIMFRLWTKLVGIVALSSYLDRL